MPIIKLAIKLACAVLIVLVAATSTEAGNKKKNDASGLSQCTIQQSGSSGGCKSGFKWVCEKLKKGKKCCGCVVDKNAPPKAQEFCCSAIFGGKPNGSYCADKASAEKLAGTIRVNGAPPDSVSCVPK